MLSFFVHGDCELSIMHALPDLFTRCELKYHVGRSTVSVVRLALQGFRIPLPDVNLSIMQLYRIVNLAYVFTRCRKYHASHYLYGVLRKKMLISHNTNRCKIYACLTPYNWMSNEVWNE